MHGLSIPRANLNPGQSCFEGEVGAACKSVHLHFSVDRLTRQDQKGAGTHYWCRDRLQMVWD